MAIEHRKLCRSPFCEVSLPCNVEAYSIEGKGWFCLPDGFTLWELPRRGNWCYVLVAPRGTIESLTKQSISGGRFNTAEDIATAVEEAGAPQGLIAKIDAACLLVGGRVVSRVKDVDHTLVFRNEPSKGWEEDSLQHLVARETVAIESSAGGISRVKLSSGLSSVDFLPVDAGKRRDGIMKLMDKPVLAGGYQVSKKLVFAALSFVVLMFGPAIRERINPVLAPVTERVPDMHSRGELVGVVLEFLQLDHAIAFLASLFSPVGAILVPIVGLGTTFLVGWKGARNSRAYWDEHEKRVGAVAAKAE